MSIQDESRAVARLKARYVDAAIKYGAACDAHSHPLTVNRYARRVIAAARGLKRAGDEGKQALNSLLDHDNPYVRVWAANDVYPFDEQRALAALEEVKKLSGRVALDAEFSICTLRGKTPPRPTKHNRSQ